MDVVKLDVQSSSDDQQIKHVFGIALERMTATNSVAASVAFLGLHATRWS